MSDAFCSSLQALPKQLYPSLPKFFEPFLEMYDPDLYDSYSQFQRKDATELVPYLVSKMTPKNVETVLDFGCGTGYNTRHIILPSLTAATEGQHSAAVYGVDLSRKMIEFASVRYEHRDVRYMVADVMKDDCEFPCQFDKIFSLHVLHWIADQRKALISLWRLLKPAGEIAFYHIASAAVFHVYEKMSELPQWKPYTSDVTNFIPKSYFSQDPAKDMNILMTSIGFQVQEAKNCRRKFCFGSFAEMIEAAMAANPFFHRIPDNLKEAYKVDFCRCFMPLVREVPTESNPNAVEVEYNIILVRATK